MPSIALFCMKITCKQAKRAQEPSRGMVHRDNRVYFLTPHESIGSIDVNVYRYSLVSFSYQISQGAGQTAESSSTLSARHI